MTSKSNRSATLATSTAAALVGSLAGRNLVRDEAGARHHIPVSLVDGDRAPKLVGSGYYWTTPSGKTIVHHPSAYGWRTWYHCSTRTVEVGRDWRPLANAA